MTQEEKRAEERKSLWEVEVPVAAIRPGKMEIVESIHEQVSHARDFRFNSYNNYSN